MLAAALDDLAIAQESACFAPGSSTEIIRTKTLTELNDGANFVPRKIPLIR